MSVRQELIERLAKKNPSLAKHDIHFIVTECFEYLSTGLAAGERVEIRGFGSFKINEKQVVSSLAKNNSTKRKTVRYKSSINIGEIPWI